MRNILFPDSGGHMYEKYKLVYDLWHLMYHLLEMNREMYLSFQEEASSAMYAPFIRMKIILYQLMVVQETWMGYIKAWNRTWQ